MDKYEKSKVLTIRYKKVKKLLKIIYGYDSFRPKQYEIINRIINGEDVCALLPTGQGKSICFQIPTLYLDKPAIIIFPLISLMEDQQIILNKLGITSCCYNSSVQNKYEMRQDILNGKYQFIFLTPESVIKLKDFIVELNEKRGISLVAIDEAHCISSYGFDFRKAYRELTLFKEILPQTPILALTATATHIIGKDICKTLQLKTQEPIKTSFDRPNLFLEVRSKSNKASNDIIPIIQKHENQSIIIYCVTKKETENIVKILKTFKIECGMYHGDLDSKVKSKAHKNFVNGKVNVMVATIAFGMGINKSDVRAVIHYGAPKNIEGYYQEIGRAGRDGKNSYCYAFYNYRDFAIQESLIKTSTMTTPAYKENLLKLLGIMKNYLTAKRCRRQILLEYFEEEYPDKCNFCDNCCGKIKIENTSLRSKQDVHKESKILIDLIESIKDRSFGAGMYINILRGSNNKNITANMRKSKFYGTGKNHSVVWWQEVIKNLIERGFLQYVSVGFKNIQVIKVTQQGLSWANMAELSGLVGDLDIIKFEPMEMETTI
ncbi:helicase [Moumouvirus goulette]|uniref:Helicase n=1 Tax=Moumouvirus goulette TaxID=1247379 RepID=M1PGQ0_9VIRU|nr:helicase [Moumouvirus goulette]AGF85188.1 helicase [Moumouvirus goulette]